MKKSILLCLLAFSFSVSAQTIRRVNNNADITGVNVYTTIQAAHDAAVAGDIVYVEPSTTPYSGGLISTISLTIIGNGYLITENAGTTMPTDSRLSELAGGSNIEFRPGSENSKLIGVKVDNVNIKVPNITVQRCHINSSININYYSTATYAITVGDNAVISHCYFKNGSSQQINGSSVPISAGFSRYPSKILVRNNISVSANYTFVGNIQESLVLNNTAQYNFCGGSIFNTIFNNNVVINPSPTTPYITTYPQYFQGSTFNNNVSICAACNHFPTGNGNVNNVTASIYFTNTSFTTSTIDSQLQIKSGSPGLTAGLGGGQVGAFGGNSPYLIAGLPDVPIITTLINSGVGNTSTPLQLNVTTRGNN